MSAKYVFRLDDIAPNMDWESFRRLEQLFDSHGVKPLVGVIPDNRDPELLRWPLCPSDFWQEVNLLVSKGWTVALHGYRHVYNTQHAGLMKVVERSEFAGHTIEDQLAKIRAGMAILKAHGVHTDTFFAPSHSFDELTIEALKACGIRRISDGYSLFPYEDRGMLWVPQLVERPRSFPLGVHTFALHLNGMDGALFSAVKRFVSCHSNDIISFDEASSRALDSLADRICGRLISHALRLKRKLGRASNSSGAIAGHPTPL